MEWKTLLHLNKDSCFVLSIKSIDQIEIDLFAVIDSCNGWGVEDETAIHIDFGQGAKLDSNQEQRKLFSAYRLFKV